MIKTAVVGKLSDARWSDAARPTLFSASAWPDLIISILLSHLMSPRLWALAARSVKSAGPGRDERIAAISHFINHRFFHANKFDFARFWGIQERTMISDPVERAESDYAMSVLMKCMPRSVSDAPTIEMVMEWLRKGQCPQYAYPAIEIIEALPGVCDAAPHRTLGITSCLDECVLIAALAVATGCCRLNELVLLGSPFHYALFILPDGPGVWLNGKRGMINEAAWQASVAGRSAAEIQAAFEDKMVLCDRVVTPAGYCRLPRGPATLPGNRMNALASRLRCFFGTDIREIQSAVSCAAGVPSGQNEYPSLDRLDGCASAEQFAARLRALLADSGHPMLEASLYAFRVPDVLCPAAYIAAAQRGFRVLLRAAEVTEPADALEISRSVAGTQSVFGDSGRLALPDEVLLLGTASPSEKALLVHTLLSLSLTLGAEARTSAQLVGRPDDWQVTWQDRPL